MNFYDFNAKKQDGTDVNLGQYKGKVVLVVNTATECGFTPQYKELEEIYQKLNAKGLEILDFPCNQFGAQAPGTNDEIQSFCTLKYHTTFPRFSKIEVNGEGQMPLYEYLKSEKGFKGFDVHPIAPILKKILSKADPDWESKSDIKWNFTKFLISRDGKVVARFEPTASLKKVEKAIEEQL
ncbi:MAG: glutathione peroxidase [Sphaerochaetaceae bacterium]|jgi:glutathione peroxidase|nr:glutathione peroxidase [Sphaerochaetaceae bacterium]MDD3162643.1 glutathione peroxidase [Sphaerochaetaceae bacterium]MDD4007616.1 glutathione peroxidase [Sphaerochaetaceae bacterium]MDD4396769.1 glutathione peroxidase [Sphaerochaetaceae bacterium]